jgi:DNA-binding transcriptional ArsR family regulator
MRGREFKNAIFERVARVAAAFGSPKRIELIDILAQGRRNVETLANETSLSFANTSRHLQVLKMADLVVSSKEGLQVFYRLAGPRVIESYRILRSLAEARLAEMDRLARDYFGGTDGLDPLGRDELLDLEIVAYCRGSTLSDVEKAAALARAWREETSR